MYHRMHRGDKHDIYIQSHCIIIFTIMDTTQSRVPSATNTRFDFYTNTAMDRFICGIVSSDNGMVAVGLSPNRTGRNVENCLTTGYRVICI